MRMTNVIFRSLTAVSCCIASAAMAAQPFPNNPRDGASCTYAEVGGGSGAGPRTLHITCGLNGHAYTCDYKANPHTCNYYNNGHQAQVYLHLATVAARYATGCTASNLEDRNNCPGVIFQKQ
jgi:hypothetical protein